MKRQAYPSDLTNSQWNRLKGLLPAAKPGGRPRSVDLREIINGILDIVRGGSSWRMMPHDLPPWNTCYDYFRKWRNDGLWQRINDTLRDQVRRKAGRKKSPSMALIDSQSTKTTEQGGPRGKDPHKKVNGRKRHRIVDTLGMILAVVVHSAGIQDRDGAKLVLARIFHPYVQALSCAMALRLVGFGVTTFHCSRSQGHRYDRLESRHPPLCQPRTQAGRRRFPGRATDHRRRRPATA